MKVFLLLGLVFSLTANAEGEARQAFLLFLKRAPSPECARKVESLAAFRHLFTLKPFREWLSSKGGKLVLGPALSGWSTDLTTEIVQEIEQSYLVRCNRPIEMETVADALKAIYLETLGLQPDRFSSEDRASLFRALAVPKNDVAVLKGKLAPVLEKGTTQEMVEAAYGGKSNQVRGVWLLNADAAQVKTASDWLTLLCPTESCAFWDSRFLWRVVVGPARGVAAYVPEFGALVISQELLAKPSELHRLVFVHELVHVAEKAHPEGARWVTVFAAFSGWKLEGGRWKVDVEKVAAQRLDVLAEQSLSSSFGILPESFVVFGKRGKERLDGFVFEKTYRESLRRGDLSEDIADHVATFHVHPQRFCFKGKNLAPRKAEWVRKQLFPTTKPIDCRQISS